MLFLNNSCLLLFCIIDLINKYRNSTDYQQLQVNFRFHNDIETLTNLFVFINI